MTKRIRHLSADADARIWALLPENHAAITVKGILQDAAAAGDPVVHQHAQGYVRRALDRLIAFGIVEWIPRTPLDDGYRRKLL